MINIITFKKYKKIIENICSNETDTFFIMSKCFLISKIRNKTNDGDDILKKVYPYIFENDNFNYDDSKIIEFIELLQEEKGKDIIGLFYEQTINNDNKKDLGQFYTRNLKIIDYMLDLKSDYDLKILEPSCGSGLFITSIIDRFLLNTNVKDIESKLFKIFNDYSAIDIDDLACKITEINILIETIDYIKLAYNYNENFELPKLNISLGDFIDYKVENNFDLIIGNPPYITLYGKRSRNMTEEKRAKYNKFDFVLNKKGNNKFNTVMFFIENSIKALKDNGQLIFIIDMSFFETAYVDIRKYILNHCYIESITTNICAFENVASGQIVLSLIKGKNKGKTKWIDYETNDFTLLDQDIWDDKNNSYKIYLPLSNYQKRISDKLNICKKLDYYFPNKSLRTCCALTGKTEEFVVEKEFKTSNIVFPYLEGSKGIKKKFGKPTNIIYIEFNYDKQIEISNNFKTELEKLGVKNKKRVTLGDKEAYLSPKIFIRQSANEIICTYTDKPYAANNSIYILSNKIETEEEIKKLKYTCAILNSDLITFYAKINNIIRGGNGKTPQIKTSDLKNIPIEINNNFYEIVIEICEKLLKKFNEDDFNKLNNLVYNIYNIDNDEIDYIKNYLKKDED